MPRCNTQITKLLEPRFHAVLGDGGRGVHLEWGQARRLVEDKLSEVRNAVAP